MSERHPINYLSYPSSFILFLIGYALFVYPESGNGNIKENKSTASVTAEDIRRKWDAEEIIRDLDHIKEDLNNILELHESGAISPNDSLFYFFRMHDFDDNKMLDGIELIVAVRHSFEHSNQPEDEMPLVEVVLLEEMELRLVPLWTVIISSSLPIVMLREPRHNGHVPDLLDKGSSSILHDERHIRADLYNYFGVSMDETLTNSEIGVYFFQLHDLDKDNRLDGLEILAAINHVADNVYDPSDDENEASHPATYFVQQKWNTKFANDAVVIDKILQENDLNKDGFLIYSEYALARQRT